MIAINDNLTGDEFKANVEPKPTAAEMRFDPAGVSYAVAQRGQQFVLMRVGRFRAHPTLPREFQVFPVAGAPHPLCPPHTYSPPAAKRPPLRTVKRRGDHLRVVA